MAVRRRLPMTPAELGAAGRAGDTTGAVAPALKQRERQALAWAQASAAVALIGTFVLPTLANLAAFALLVSFAVLPTAGQRLRAVLAEPVARAALLLWAVMALATLWSDAPPIERLRYWWGWRPLLLLVLALAIFDAPAARHRALIAFVAAAAAGAVYSFWAWANDISTVSNNHGMTGIVLRNAVTQGMAFALACYLAAMLAVTERALGPLRRALLGVAALLLLANLVFVTSSRAAHLLLLIVLAVSALQLLRGFWRLAAIAALPLLAALAFSVSPMLQTRFGLLVDELRAPLASEHLSAMGIRSVIWNVSLRMVAERPLLGYGTGGFAGAYRQALERTSLTGWAATPSDDPHNQFLSVQLQAGVAGSAALAWFLVAALRRRAPPPYRTWATAVLLGWCATSLATSMFSSFAEGHMLMLVLGILLAAPPPAGER